MYPQEPASLEQWVIVLTARPRGEEDGEQPHDILADERVIPCGRAWTIQIVC